MTASATIHRSCRISLINGFYKMEKLSLDELKHSLRNAVKPESEPINDVKSPLISVLL